MAMGKIELIRMIDFHKSELQKLQTLRVCCAQCEHYELGGKNVCLKFNAAPPAEVAAVGCDEWVLFDIPF